MRQIQDVFQAPLGMGADMDEDELMGELEELEASELDKELLAPAPVPATRVSAHLCTYATADQTHKHVADHSKHDSGHVLLHDAFMGPHTLVARFAYAPDPNLYC